MVTKRKKVYVVGNAISYANWLEEIGFELTRNSAEADLALFTGGEDVNPDLYNENEGYRTHTNKTRDGFELPMHSFFFKNNIPMLGICRGGQLLTVLSGGKLVQDMRHPSNHRIKTYDGKELTVTSSHHQQFLLKEEETGLIEGTDYKLIGWAEKLSPFHLNGNNKDYQFSSDYKEPEIVYFPNTNSLAIQSHPEWQELEHPTVKYLQNLVQQLLNKTICQQEKELVS